MNAITWLNVLPKSLHKLPQHTRV